MFRTTLLAWCLLLTASCYNAQFIGGYYPQSHEPRYPIFYPNQEPMPNSFFRKGEGSNPYARQNQLPVWLVRQFSRIVSSIQSVVSTTLAGLFPELFQTNTYYFTVTSTSICTVSTESTCNTNINRRRAAIQEFIHHIEPERTNDDAHEEPLPDKKSVSVRAAAYSKEEDFSAPFYHDTGLSNSGPLVGSLQDPNDDSETHSREVASPILQQALFYSKFGFNTISITFTITTVVPSRSTPACSTPGLYSQC